MLKRRTGSDSGFTLIEILIVVALFSIFAMTIIPRISRTAGDEKESVIILTGTAVKAFDDSFLNDHINYLVIYLHDPSADFTQTRGNLFNKTNGIAVLNLVKGRFAEHRRKIFRFRKFPDSFRLDEILFSQGEKITQGTAMIPFYPQGYGANAIIHITSGEKKMSIRIYKYIKEPKVFPEHITFED